MNYTFLIDADDTLWENYQYFKDGIKIFLDFMEDKGFNRYTVAPVLEEIDHSRCHDFGFGSKGFRLALEKTIEHFYKKTEKIYGEDEAKCLEQIQSAIFNHPVIPYQGVEDTLRYLDEKYPLFLVTKGTEVEQLPKVKKSGLSCYFKDIYVVTDKTQKIYSSIISELGLEAEFTWMVGNSPKSDINPPASLGMGTVFVEKDDSWNYESETLKNNGKFYKIKEFSELKKYF